jgi:hypothetical protein
MLSRVDSKDRLMIKRLLCAATLCAAPAAALADQFAYVTVQQAAAALAELDGQPLVQSYCAPCGDAKATPVDVQEIGIERVWHWDGGASVYFDAEGRSYWEVMVNGKGIDLAYVYVRGDAGGWENLAMRLGLSPVDVPRQLDAATVAP